MTSRNRVWIWIYLLGTLVLLFVAHNFMQRTATGRDIAETHWGLNLLYYAKILERVSRSDGYEIEQGALEQRAQSLTTAPTLSPGSGLYSSAFSVAIALPDGAIGYYSLDGSVPTRAHDRVSGPIRIERSTVLRVVAFDGGLSSNTVSASYIITKMDEHIAADLVLDPVYLFNRHSGIYSNPHQRGRAWERPATLNIFDPASGTVINGEVRVRIHGGASRGMPDEGRKSIRLIVPESELTLRDWLGAPSSGNSSEQSEWVLRHAGNEQQFLSDRFALRIAHQLGLAATYARPVVLHINGNLWGVYDVMERMNEEFFLGKEVGDEFTLLHPSPLNDPLSDSARYEEWNQLYRFIFGADLSETDAYEFVASQLDIPTLIDYFAMSIFLADPERPQWNIDLYREKGDADRPPGKWKFAVWDFDGGLNYKGLFAHHDTLAWHLRDSLRDDLKIVGQEGDVVEYMSATRLLRGLMRSAEFRNAFRKRFDELLMTTFSPHSLSVTLDELLRDYHAVLPLEKRRLGESPGWLLEGIVRIRPSRNPITYEERMQQIRTFIAMRADVVSQHLADHLGDLAGRE